MYLSLLVVVVVFQFKLNYYATLCASQGGTLLLLHHQHQNHQLKHHHRQVRSSSSYNFMPSDQNPSQQQQQQQHQQQQQRLLIQSDQSEVSASNYHLMQDKVATLDQCCACDEAKYELVFEGLWSKYTHPDEFPENQFLASFSDIIGASHSNEFRLWQQDTFASEGVKELAEMGSTKKLESELKQVSSKTRTIIKARELRYPTLNSKTSAVFRTDRQHHLVSILSKLSPSPDWMVGVSGLELCQTDCSWIPQQVVNLYLWDAGTDSGTSFTSSDSISRPQERIHPYWKASSNNKSQMSNQAANNNNNNLYDFNSTNGGGIYSSSSYGLRNNSNMNQTSFYGQNQSKPNINQNSNGGETTDSATGYNYQPPVATITTTMSEQVKPFARLTITRQRIYEKSCNLDNQTQGFNTNTVTLRPTNFDSLLPLITQPEQNTPSSDCRFTEWSDWSYCSSTCGKGIRTRTRAFVDEQAQLAGCSQVDLIEKEVCLAECFGNEVCITRNWSEWSECSVQCGQGQRQRSRSPLGPMKGVCQSLEFVQTEPCTGAQTFSPECSSYSNKSNTQQLQQTPSNQHPGHKLCPLTNWTHWSECSVACGRGVQIRTRQFLRKEDAERQTCSSLKLYQKQSCTGRFGEFCSSSPKKTQHASNNNNNNNNDNNNKEEINPNLPVVDCKLSGWSPWSTCSALCGSGKRTRSRHIIQMPQNGGRPCDRKLTRTQTCKNLPPCPPLTGQFTHHNHHQYTNSNSNTTHSNGQQPSSSNLKSHHSTNNNNGKHNSNGHLNKSNHPELSMKSRTTTSTTTAGSSMMDDEDDMEDNNNKRDENTPCAYGDWSQWSECEVVCQPVKKGSNKRRQKLPLDSGQSSPDNSCPPVEEYYYCDPDLYC